MRILTRPAILLALPAMLLGLARPGPAPAQEMEVPIGTQMSLLTRILDYDRRLAERDGDELVIGILYQSRYRASYNAFQGAARAIGAEPRPAGARRIRTVGIEVADPRQLGGALRRNRVDVLYLAPLRALDGRALADKARASGVLTFTGAADLRDGGVAVYFGTRGGRPRLRIDLAVARSAGADFSSELLRLADVVGGTIAN